MVLLLTTKNAAESRNNLSFLISDLDYTETTIFKTMVFTFEERIQQLVEFENTEGHMFVPNSHADKGLGGWVKEIKKQRKKNNVKQERVDALNDIGFPWVAVSGPEKAQIVEWGKHYKQLAIFHSTTGHCNVPQIVGGEDNPIFPWCQEQRRLHVTGKLAEAQTAKLSKLGFDFYLPEEEKEKRKNL